MKVNFKQFGIYTDITKKEKRTLDIRQAIADKLYTSVPGIAAKDLALRIYRSEEDINLSESDYAIMKEFMAQCSGALSDSFEDALKED